jgi:hypothetical protein
MDSKWSEDYVSPFHKSTGPICYSWLQDIVTYGAGMASNNNVHIKLRENWSKVIL